MWTKKKSIFFYLDKNIPYPAKCYPTNNVHFEGNENKCEYNHVGYVIYYVKKKELKTELHCNNITINKQKQ